MTYRPNLPAAIATTSQAGVVKPDGTTLTIAADATTSVVGTPVTALTDISSGLLGGPAASDVDSLNRAGTDYKVTLSARAAYFRKTPAGSRTITLVSGSNTATLTSTDNDRQVVITGGAGSLAVDGTISDGFSCLVINKTGAALALTGISGIGNQTSIAATTAARVYMAASTVEVASLGGGSPLSPATTTSLGGVKPDGASLATSGDGTLSVITTTTHALPTGGAIAGSDEIATYSGASNSDVKYSLAQISGYSLTNIQSWATSARPSAVTGQYVLGYNTTLGRFEFWNGSAWNQHVRVSDMSASTTQLLGGTGSNGSAAAINLGAGLILSNGTLSAPSGITPVLSVPASGSSQVISFPSTGNRAYDVTLSANCTLSLSGGTNGEFQTVTLVIRGGAGGFTVSFPNNIKWKGGTPPSVDTSAGSLYVLRIQTSDGGATYAGGY